MHQIEDVTEDETAETDGRLEDHGSDRLTAGRSLSTSLRARILLIDDCIELHDLIRAELSDEPYDLVCACDAKTGLCVGQRSAFDLVLLDLDLPDINGFDVCRALKTHPTSAASAIVFLTASTGTDEMECGFELKASDYITKPFNPQELRLRIRKAIRVKRMLDLLPQPSDAPEASPSPGQSFVQRLSFTKLMCARKLNPWQRIGPRKDQSDLN